MLRSRLAISPTVSARAHRRLASTLTAAALLSGALLSPWVPGARALPAGLPWYGSPIGGQAVIIQPGVAAVTCGTVLAIDPAERYSFGLMNLEGGFPLSSRTDVTANVAMYHDSTWLVSTLGNVFGVAINERTGDIFVSASSNYGAGFFGSTAALSYGSIGGGANSLLAAGTIYRIDAATGQAYVFTVLPQQSVSITHQDCEGTDTLNRTTGVGLGNLHYDSLHDQFFVTNVEDGRIYRLANDGTILDSYDPGLYDDGQPGISSLTDLPYGLAVEPGGQRLFFGGVSLTSMVPLYSIDLDGSGGFLGLIDNTTHPAPGLWDNYVGVETLHTSLIGDTGGQLYHLADLEFLPDAKLLAGIRVGCGPSWFTSYNHGGRSWVASPSGGIYNSGLTPMDISFTEEDSYGGVGYYARFDGSINYVVSSADILTEAGPHGIAVFDETDAGGAPVSPLSAISYGIPGDLKGVGGSVDVFSDSLPGLASNHYKVYDVDDVDFGRSVVLDDQFGSITTRAGTIDLFANPADKNGEGIPRAEEHQKWYAITDPDPLTRQVDYFNQFGLQQLTTQGAAYLVVPAEKNDEGEPGFCREPAASQGTPCVRNLDCDVAGGDGVCADLRHFLCYDVVDDGSTIGQVTLDDQFGGQDVDVLEPRHFCNPVQKTVDCCNADLNGDGTVDITDFNLFSACLSNPACDFNCDGISNTADFAILSCQFGTTPPDPACCAGVEPEVYPIVDPLFHLTCYDIDPKVDANLSVTTDDQFDGGPLQVRTNEMLCVPSIKVAFTVPEPAAFSQLAAGIALLGLLQARRRRARAG